MQKWPRIAPDSIRPVVQFTLQNSHTSLSLRVYWGNESRRTNSVTRHQKQLLYLPIPIMIFTLRTCKVMTVDYAQVVLTDGTNYQSHLFSTSGQMCLTKLAMQLATLPATLLAMILSCSHATMNWSIFLILSLIHWSENPGIAGNRPCDRCVVELVGISLPMPTTSQGFVCYCRVRACRVVRCDPANAYT